VSLVARIVGESFHRDVEGRPLREGRTPAEHLRAGDIEYRSCPFSGQRRGRPMNASALRQTSAHWDELLAALASLRAGYVAALGPHEEDLLDVWRTSQLGCALPWWFVLRGQPVPAYAAALAKATQGAGILAQRLVAKQLAERWSPPPPLSPGLLVALAETTGTLVGETEVCAGSEKMLLRFFDVMLATEQWAYDRRVIAFGAHYIALKQLLWLDHLARRFLYADLGAFDELARPVEPPDFFLVEPTDLATVPRLHRAAWLSTLARQLVPFADDDACYPELARGIAIALGAPATAVDALARLDALRADAIARVDAGLAAALSAREDGSSPASDGAASEPRETASAG
jgi:hypothetical protein